MYRLYVSFVMRFFSFALRVREKNIFPSPFLALLLYSHFTSVEGLIKLCMWCKS